MGCKTSIQDKDKSGEMQKTRTEAMAEKFKKQRENRFKYMENIPKLNIGVRRLGTHEERVNSPAVFMYPSGDCIANKENMMMGSNMGREGQIGKQIPLRAIS